MPTVIQVNMHEATSQLSQLAERVWAGDRVVITRAGKPYLDLLPHQPQMVERRPGNLKGRIRIEPGFDTVDTDIAESMFSVGVRRDAIDYLAKQPDESRAK